MRDRVIRALCLALLVTVLLGALLVVWRLAAGDELKTALRSTSALQSRKLLLPSGLDSWGPMLAARHRQRLGGAVYADTLQLDNCKFQYPPAALLLLDLLPAAASESRVCSADAMLSATLEPWRWDAKPWIDWASRLSWLATVLVSALIVRRALALQAVAASQPATWWEGAVCALVLALGASFYPLIWGHEIGQIQVFLNLLVAASVLAVLEGRRALAGVLMGLCCLFKPQYAVLLVWALLRRDGRLGAGLVLVAGLGTAIAIARFGVAMHLDYLDFLRGLARHGESFWPNQSVNGLLNRWLGNGSALQWADSAFSSNAPTPLGATVDGEAAAQGIDWVAAGFPGFHPVVYAATLLSSLAILALALWRPRATPGLEGAPGDHGALARTLDFSVVVAACTLASPIAWLHHYGSFFPLFAVALVAALQRADSAASRGGLLLPVLGASYALTANELLQPELIYRGSVSGLLGSHVWLGAVMLLGVLWVLRDRRWRLRPEPTEGRQEGRHNSKT